MDWMTEGASASLRAQYQSAQPFPHIVIDDFLPDSYLENLLSDIAAVAPTAWCVDEHEHQRGKRWLSDLFAMPPAVHAAVSFLNSETVVRFLKDLTGIYDLQPDPWLLGGGVHVTSTGGKLSVHADFNRHLATQKHRRVNLLLYLNKDWEPSHLGELELWDKDVSRCVQSIAPIFNRAVILNINDTAFHGHPTVYMGDERISLATYYYTDDRPESEKAAFHWALWQNT